MPSCLGDVRYLVDSDDQIPAYRIKDEDRLFTRYNGSLQLLGVCGMVRGLGDNLCYTPTS